MAKGKRRAGRGEASAPVTTTLGPARRSSRAAQRKRRQRQRRTRLSIGAIAGIVVLALLAVVAIGTAVHQVTKGSGDTRTQRTVLLEVTNTNGSARAAALLAYDPQPKDAALVLIPPHTLADVAGLGNVVLANALRLGGPGTAKDAVSDLMGVLVDHDWTLTGQAFSTLVDRVGGVVVDVDTDVVVPGPKHTTRILVRAGDAQRLDGATALTYATYVPKGQDEITFQARFQEVFDGLLAGLPDDPGAVSGMVGSLGAGAHLSWKPADLAAYLLGMKAAHDTDRYSPQVLPVAPIDTGASAPTFSIKVDEVAALVHSQLAESQPPNRATGDNRVLILNGVGTPGLGGSVAKKLRGEFRVVGTRNKQPFDQKESVVVVFDSSDPSLAKARRVAELLGLPASAVRIGTQNQSVADVIVVIGSDYKG